MLSGASSRKTLTQQRKPTMKGFARSTLALGVSLALRQLARIAAVLLAVPIAGHRPLPAGADRGAAAGGLRADPRRLVGMIPTRLDPDPASQQAGLHRSVI
jgi:hypothetical protein